MTSSTLRVALEFLSYDFSLFLYPCEIFSIIDKVNEPLRISLKANRRDASRAQPVIRLWPNSVTFSFLLLCDNQLY